MSRPTIRLEAPGAVRWIVRTLEAGGYETWAVGGAVRDALAGRASLDWDFATRATPAEVRRTFRRTVPIGLDHGTVGVLARDGTLYEVTTFRRDVTTTGRHAVVAFAQTLDEDLARRDFTINATAWHPVREIVYDPYDGRGDLEQGVLRTVGAPHERFAEDHLRILRALRFAGVFRLRVEGATWRALTAAADRTRMLSPERLREELEKVLASHEPPSRTLALYAASGVLALLYPEWHRLIGFRRAECGDWYSHNLRTVDLLSGRRSLLRWAALFQGVGEPEGASGLEGGEPAPESRASRRAAALLLRLRSSNANIGDVSHLARWVTLPPDPDSSDADLRRWLSSVGRQSLSHLLRIWIARARSDTCLGRPEFRGEVTRLATRLRGLSHSRTPLSVDDLALTGRDLIRLGYRPGPLFGEVLEHLLDLVLEDPELNSPERLREAAVLWMDRSREPSADRGMSDHHERGGS